MKKMRTLICSVIVIGVIAILAGCGEEPKPSKPKPKAKPTPKVDSINFKKIVDEFQYDADAGNRVAMMICRFANYTMKKYNDGDTYKNSDKPPAKLEEKMLLEEVQKKNNNFWTFIIANCQFKGIGTDENIEKSVNTLKSLSGKGDIFAKHVLGCHYLLTANNHRTISKGLNLLNGIAKFVIKDKKNVTTILYVEGSSDRRIKIIPPATCSYPPALISLGNAYAKGIGVEKDERKALEYFTDAKYLNIKIVDKDLLWLFNSVRKKVDKAVATSIKTYKDSSSCKKPIADYRNKLIKENKLNDKFISATKFPSEKVIQKLTKQGADKKHDKRKLSTIQKASKKKYPLYHKGDKVTLTLRNGKTVSGKIGAMSTKDNRDGSLFGAFIGGKPISAHLIREADWIKFKGRETEALRTKYVQINFYNAKKIYEKKLLVKTYIDNGYVKQHGYWKTTAPIMKDINRKVADFKTKHLKNKKHELNVKELADEGWILCNGISGTPIKYFEKKQEELTDLAVEYIALYFKFQQRFPLGVRKEAEKLTKELFKISKIAKDATTLKYHDRTYAILRAFGIVLYSQLNSKKYDVYKNELLKHYEIIMKCNNELPELRTLIAERTLMRYSGVRITTKRNPLREKLSAWYRKYREISASTCSTGMKSFSYRKIRKKLLDKISGKETTIYAKVNGKEKIVSSSGLQKLKADWSRIMARKRNLYKYKKEIAKIKKELKNMKTQYSHYRGRMSAIDRLIYTIETTEVGGVDYEMPVFDASGEE